MTDNKLKKPAKINAYLKLVAEKKKLVGNGCLLFYLEKKVGMPVRTLGCTQSLFNVNFTDVRHCDTALFYWSGREKWPTEQLH